MLVASTGNGPNGPRVSLLLGSLALAWVAVACAQRADGLRPHAPPPGSESARRLEPGPDDGTSDDLHLVDESRATMPSGDFPGAASRSIVAPVWQPVGAEDPRPLLVHAHGFTGNRRELANLLEHLASHGNVVASRDSPLTNGDAPGEPTPRDLARQPGAVRFPVDALLRRRGPRGPDRSRPHRPRGSLLRSAGRHPRGLPPE